MIQRFFVIFLTLLFVIPPHPSPVAASSNQIAKDFQKGLSVAMEAMKELSIVDDPEKLKRLNDIGYRVAHSAAEDMPYFSFHIVRMEEPNAFALPGGYIFVSSGMLDLDLTDDEMAALVGHEIIHVRNDHSHKMAKRQTLMNLLYQALIIGIAVGIKEGNQGIDPITGLRDRSNKSEILQGSAAFGLVFQELLLRGFNRDLEMEADHEGMIAAGHAGFSPEGTSQLFEKMRRRIYEAPGYGYLRTHPYFEDRVAAARALAPNFSKAKNPPDATEYRTRTQANLLHSLDNFKKDEEKKVVRKIALNAWPKGKSADELRWWFIREAENTENSKKEAFFRDYGRLIKLYQESLKQMKENNSSPDLVDKLQQNLTKIQQDKESVRPLYEEVLGRQMFDTDMLRRYISNFPDSPRLSEVRYRLAENYRILKKNSEAVDLYLAVVQPAADSIWKEKSKESLMQMTSSLQELSSCYKIMQQASDPKLKQASEERMKTITAKFDSLQNGYEFRRNYPTSTYEKPVRAQMTKLAGETLNQAKLYQAVGEYQKALDHYNEILRYCSDLPVADQVKDSIVDFQELEAVKS
jgi:predicted Zn-dependent protease